MNTNFLICLAMLTSLLPLYPIWLVVWIVLAVLTSGIVRR